MYVYIYTHIHLCVCMCVNKYICVCVCFTSLCLLIYVSTFVIFQSENLNFDFSGYSPPVCLRVEHPYIVQNCRHTPFRRVRIFLQCSLIRLADHVCFVFGVISASYLNENCWF